MDLHQAIALANSINDGSEAIDGMRSYVGRVLRGIHAAVDKEQIRGEYSQNPHGPRALTVAFGEISTRDGGTHPYTWTLKLEDEAVTLSLYRCFHRKRTPKIAPVYTTSMPPASITKEDAEFVYAVVPLLIQGLGASIRETLINWDLLHLYTRANLAYRASQRQ